MSVGAKLVTADELARVAADGPVELVEGEIREMSPAGFEHGRIAMLVGISLGTWVRSNGLGEVTAAETGFILRRDPDTVRAPDIGFVRRERLVQTSGFFPGAPDLAIEVISPGDTYSEVEEKVSDWLRSGVKMVVIVDPAKKSASVHRSMTETRRLTIDGVIDGEDVVPGWRLEMRELF